MKIAILGGGPIGVEAALYGACAGFDVSLFERGQIAQSVREWGHVQVFTEWKRNRSPLAVRLLREQGVLLPPGEEYSSGDELADYVQNLSALAPLQNRVFSHTQVRAITRRACLKSDYINDPRRADFPFRLLLRDARGERIEFFDAVLDATGTYATPNWMGSGGAPCVGEIDCKERIDYKLPDVPGKERARFAGRSTLVVGSGHSAASTLLSVANLMNEFPTTKLVWIVRRDVPPHGAPYTIVAEETSATRARLHRRVNALMQHPNVTFLPRTTIEKVSHNGKVFLVEISTKTNLQPQVSSLRVDNIAAHVGFRADARLWSELPIEIYPPTGAPRLLGEALHAQNLQIGVGLSTGYAEKKPRAENTESEIEKQQQNSRDRWSFLVDDPQLLQTGEPNFFVIGMKSYGRDAGFLMHNGFRQVRDVYKILSGDKVLDLYEGALDAARK
jgi:thioredoxin reductase